MTKREIIKALQSIDENKKHVPNYLTIAQTEAIYEAIKLIKETWRIK